MKKLVRVTQDVEVKLDETKFTPEFMKEFRQHFYPFRSINDHFEHIGQLEARGILRDHFVEGYGPIEEFGIKARVVDCEIEVVK